MDEKLQTTLLEYDKSTFLLDLIKHSNGKLYVAIQQTIHLDKDNYEIHKIKINPTILQDIIVVLTQYKEKLPIDNIPSKNYFSTEKVRKITKRFLNSGVEIKHLAMQFDCPEAIIEQILHNQNIEIESSRIFKKKFYNRKRKR